MESTTYANAAPSYTPPPAVRRRPRGGALGIILIVLGALVLLDAFTDLPNFRINIAAPIFFIAIGVIIGIRSQFKNWAWVALILIGVAHLIPEFRIGGVESDSLAFAAGLIVLGLFINRTRRWRNEAPLFPERPHTHVFGQPLGSPSPQPAADGSAPTEADMVPRHLNTFSIFGGRKEIITSRAFAGGRATVLFAGTDINLLNADSTQDRIVLDVAAVFGGIEVVMPSHWELVNEVDSIFGSVEDARTLRTAPGGATKTLVLRGFCLFGGVEVKGY